LGSWFPAIGWVSEQGISCRRGLLDHGSAYRSGDWRATCQALALKPILSKTLTPQINGTAERFIKTRLEGWANLIAGQTSPDIRRTNRWRPRDLGIDNSQEVLHGPRWLQPSSV